MSWRALGVERGLALVAVKERTQVAERVDPGVVAITPGKLESIVSDLLDVADLEVTARHVLDRAAMALTVRAGAVAPEDVMGKDGLVAVRPLDLHDLRAVRRLHARGDILRIIRHAKS